MAYRYTRVEVGVAPDSSMASPDFGPARIAIEQTADRRVSSTTREVAPNSAEALVSIAPVTNGYFFALFSDYPVQVRLNDIAGTQFTLKTNGRAVVNVGTPQPECCAFLITGTVTAVYLEPIPGATTSARVRMVVTGDPTDAYT